MKFYKATGTIRLPAGVVLALSSIQVKLREHLLTVDEDGMLKAHEPVEFKAGEIIGFEQEPRGLLPLLELVEFDDLDDVEIVGIGDYSMGADSSAQAAKAGSDRDLPSFIAAIDFEHDGVAITKGDALLNFPVEVLMQWWDAEMAEPVSAEPASQSAYMDGIDSLKMTAAANLDTETAAKPAKKPAK